MGGTDGRMDASMHGSETVATGFLPGPGQNMLCGGSFELI